MPITHIVASGTNRSVGFAHGALAKEKIGKSLDLYRPYFKETVGLDWPAVHKIASHFSTLISTTHPDLFEELQGVAEGSGYDLLDIVALNARSEIVFSSPMDGCTSFSWKGKDGGQWSGQNWDWKTAAMDSIIYLDILAYEPTGRPAMKMITEAGIIGKIGMNEHGVCVMLNAIATSAQDKSSLPIHLTLRRLLEQPSVPSALTYISSTLSSRSSSTGHILLADPTTAVSIEIGPQGTGLTFEDPDGVICHSNHLIKLDASLERNLWPDSTPRLARMKELTKEAVEGGEAPSHEGYKRMLSDRSIGEKGICRYEGVKGIDTVFSISVDCKGRRGEVILGRPDEGGEEVVFEFGE